MTFLDSCKTGGLPTPLTGFSFPTKVVFGAQNTKYNDNVSSYRTAPMTKINDSNGINKQNYE